MSHAGGILVAAKKAKHRLEAGGQEMPYWAIIIVVFVAIVIIAVLAVLLYNAAASMEDFDPHDRNR